MHPGYFALENMADHSNIPINTCEKKENRGLNWGDDETSALITIWADGNIQAQLEGTRRNKAVFLKIGEKMRSEGFHRTGDQCRLKIKALRQEYKKITDNNDTSGRARKTCQFYDRLNDILGHRPASVSHYLVAIGASNSSPSPGPSTRPDARNPTPVDSDDEGASVTDETRPCTPAPGTSVDNLSGEDSAHDQEEDQKSNDISFGSTSKNLGKRRKSRSDQLQKCMERTFEKFAESQRTNMKLFIANENKRMSLEIEMEMKRWREEMAWEQQKRKEDREADEKRRREEREVDDRRRREDQEHQIRMMSMLCHFVTTPRQGHGQV